VVIGIAAGANLGRARDLAIFFMNGSLWRVGGNHRVGVASADSALEQARLNENGLAVVPALAGLPTANTPRTMDSTLPQPVAQLA
jgi:hypothetical protein